jgi:hypothetical protein
MMTSPWVLRSLIGAAGLALVGLIAVRRQREDEEEEEYHVPSLTALTAESLRRGTIAAPILPDTFPEIPGEDALLRVGDPDVDPLENAYVGDEAPGGDMRTPDQDGVDAIGRAYGVSEADSGALRTAAELLQRRDGRRSS